jgi:predicted nucleotidyltransferase
VPSRIEALQARRAAERRAQALPHAVAALDALAALGVDAGVIGSLARDRMLDHSDVDFLVLDEAGVDSDAITALVERQMRPLPVDVVTMRRVSPVDRHIWLKDLRRADELRAFLAAT